MEEVGKAFAELARVVARLRGPNGCPWDRAQTHHTLIPYLIEEAYEAAQALESQDPALIQEELGDLLLEIFLHAQIEVEAGRFGLADVATGIRDKLIRRHPHVFGESKADTPEKVRKQWEEIKREEGHSPDLARPALIAARKFLERTEVSGRKLPNTDYIMVAETPDDPEQVVGEMLLGMVALAHRWGVEPELALRRYLAHLDASPERLEER
jgi:uncharacterized protein YabN with tetrapyrrole methylase and pyrophosphatase domain